MKTKLVLLQSLVVHTVETVGQVQSYVIRDIVSIVAGGVVIVPRDTNTVSAVRIFSLLGHYYARKEYSVQSAVVDVISVNGTDVRHVV